MEYIKVFDLLQQQNVRYIHLYYDGEGDEGGITDIEFENELEQLQSPCIEPAQIRQIETLFDEFILEQFPSCYDHNGIRGEIKFDLLARKVTITHGIRVFSYDDSVYETLWDEGKVDFQPISASQAHE